MSVADLYDQDFVQWTERNAELLRAGRVAEVDLEHVAEEIEDMGKERRHALRSHLRVLVAHLLKFQFQPARRSTSWERTAAHARSEIEDLVEENPSLKLGLGGLLHSVYPKAVKLATIDTKLPKSTFPETCPYTLEQILDEEFLPE